MFDYDLSPLDKEACKWVHDMLKEEKPNWYRAVMAEVEAGKDVFSIRTLMQNRTASYEMAAHCASAARWIYREKEIDRLAAEADAPPRRRGRRRRR